MKKKLYAWTETETEITERRGEASEISNQLIGNRIDVWPRTRLAKRDRFSSKIS